MYMFYNQPLVSFYEKVTILKRSRDYFNISTS